MAIEFVTGHSGTGHISSDDVRNLFAGVIGADSYVIGDNPTVAMDDANTFSITSCNLMIQGAHVRIPSVQTCIIENGTAGAYRKDLIMIHYELDASTGVESVELKVATGEESDTEAGAIDPTTDYSSASILDGSYIVDIPIARVSLNGLTPTASLIIHPRYPIYKGTAAAEFNKRVSLGEDITAKFDSGEYSAEVAAQTFGGLALGQRIERPITIDGVNYTARAILGDGNSFYGYNSYAMIDKPHIACPVVIYDSNGNALSHNFDATNTDGGYVGVDIHAYLVDKVIPAIVNGFGADHVLKHQVLLSNAVSNGKSSSWSWVPDSYGELMSAAQCCGTEISCSYFDTGEAYRELSLFRYVRPNQVFGSIPVWLRDILAASAAAGLGGPGDLSGDGVTYSFAVVPLILLA